MSEAGTPVVVNDSVPESGSMQVQGSFSGLLGSVTLYGGYHLLKETAKKIGLTGILKDALPGHWAKALDIAFFMLPSGDPLMYCKDWLDSVAGKGAASLSSQRINNLFSDIKEDERNRFYSLWLSHVQETDCVAMDISSASS